MTKKTRAKEQTEFSEAQIAVHWKEEERFRPPKKFIEQANAKDRDIRERFGPKKFPNCFREYADMLTWFEPYRTVLDTSKPPFWKWFVGGKINASYNCVDRHLAQYRNKAALVFVPEPEDEPMLALTYQELYVRVNEMAALLRDFCGLKAGERVTLHLPMTLELPVTMLACARLGVIHSQVFGGFSGQACGTRIQDSGSRILISMDAYWRAGKVGDHKANADIAVQTAKEMGQHVDKVLIWQRYPGKASSPTPMVKGRDFFVNEVLKNYQGKRVDPLPMDAEAPLFLMYTSGSTGKPKGCQHRTGGYLAYVAGTSKYIQDIHPTDTYWCMADIGWITGHSYIVYGPLAVAATSLMYDENSKEVPAGSGRAGNICIRNPWPGIMQTIWGDPERFVDQYYARYCKNRQSKDWRDWPYLAGDGAMQAADGYFRILGRIDDVINVAGHRLGTKEIESASLTVPQVAEAAAVPVADELKGRVPEIYIALKPGYQASQGIVNRVIKANEDLIGKIARPKNVYIVPDMPKTRSGKIMRRVLASISNRKDVGDVTTLANPDVVEQIRVSVQGKEKVASKDALPEDIAKFGEND